MPTESLALVFKRAPLLNGALECRLFEYKMVAGGMRKKNVEACTLLELSN